MMRRGIAKQKLLTIIIINIIIDPDLFSIAQ